MAYRDRDRDRDRGRDRDRAASISGQAASPFVYNKHHRLSLQDQRRRLPIYKYRRDLLYLIETHATTVVVGQTGCGKTTQICQYLHECGWTSSTLEGSTNTGIVSTQPTSLAAVSVCERVAEEMGCAVGEDVGYRIRFEEKVDEARTKIEFCTDEALLRLMMENPLLERYGVVIIDEAHERSLTTDLLLGLVKKVQRRRPSLRVVISSATIDAESIAKFFRQKKQKRNAISSSNNTNHMNQQHQEDDLSARNTRSTEEEHLDRDPAIISVEGALHDVDLFYSKDPASNYIAEAVETALKIHELERPGDILVFFPSQDDVREAMEMLDHHLDRPMYRNLLPTALYSDLSPSKMLHVFRPAPRNHRKLVLSTGVAETSLTIDGIVYVVDCCFQRERYYNPMTSFECVVTSPESKASAVQRAGRAGRVRPGKCFRLCTRKAYQMDLPQASVPEMQRSELSHVVLQLKALGIDSIMSFDWVAPPSAESMIRALEFLHALGALDEQARLTSPLGMHMAELPLHPKIGKALLVSGELKCVEELLTIASMMALGDSDSVWQVGRGRRELDTQKFKFAVAEGDHICYLNVFKGFVESKFSADWCGRHCLNYDGLAKVVDIRKQLWRILQRLGVGVCQSSSKKDMLPVRQALAHGLFAQAALLVSGTTDESGRAQYLTVRGDTPLKIHQSSVLHRNQPSCVLYSTAVQTGPKAHEMFEVMAIEQDWLLEIAPHFYTSTKKT